MSRYYAVGQWLKVWWRDWRRGYSEAEVESAIAKLRAVRAADPLRVKRMA